MVKTKESWLALLKLVSNGEYEIYQVNLGTKHAKQISNGKEICLYTGILKMMGFDLI